MNFELLKVRAYDRLFPILHKKMTLDSVVTVSLGYNSRMIVEKNLFQSWNRMAVLVCAVAVEVGASIGSVYFL